MNIKILSDSTCDLSAELLQKNDITLIPLNVIKNGEAFLDGVSITPQQIYDHVAAGGSLCTTAALSVGEYEDWFAKFTADYDAIIHINISSELSCSYQNACLAADSFENVYVIDSRNLSTGQGLVVLKASELAKTAENIEDLQAALVAFTEKVEASFVLDRLEYMVKGGRCSSAAALGANLLNLKPCIEVKNGKMSVVKKYRGSYNKCLASYVKDRLSGRDDLDHGTLFVTHTPVSQECLDSVSAAVNSCEKFENTYWTKAGCTVSCHCGPGTLGVLFVRK